MPAPLMFTGIGELIVILLIVAFVVACFCLMLVGLGALIAIPLLLIMPFFYKNAKDRKESLLMCLCLIPIGVFAGMIGITLAKIFIPDIIEMVERFTLFRYIALGIGVIIITFPVSFFATRRIRREIDVLESAVKEAKKDYDFAKECKCLKAGADLKQRKEIISTICFGVVFLIVWTTALCLGVI